MKFSALKSEIFLISLAIFCQCFSYADWYFIKTIFNVVDVEHAHLVLDNFLPFWFLIYFVGKLIGTYCFGKLAQTFSYFKIMRFISFIYIAAVFLILIVLVRGQDFYSSYQTLYCACFLTSLPFYALSIFSAMYFFDKYPPSQHILIGSSIVFAILSTRFFISLLDECSVIWTYKICVCICSNNYVFIVIYLCLRWKALCAIFALCQNNSKTVFPFFCSKTKLRLYSRWMELRLFLPLLFFSALHEKYLCNWSLQNRRNVYLLNSSNVWFVSSNSSV